MTFKANSLFIVILLGIEDFVFMKLVALNERLGSSVIHNFVYVPGQTAFNIWSTCGP